MEQADYEAEVQMLKCLIKTLLILPLLFLSGCAAFSGAGQPSLSYAKTTMVITQRASDIALSISDLSTNWKVVEDDTTPAACKRTFSNNLLWLYCSVQFLDTSSFKCEEGATPVDIGDGGCISEYKFDDLWSFVVLFWKNDIFVEVSLSDSALSAAATASLDETLYWAKEIEARIESSPKT